MWKCILGLTLVVCAAFSASRVTAADETQRRVATAVRIETPPTIDGLLDDPAWSTAIWYDDFVQQRPVYGATPTERTEVAVVFDDEHVFIGARCHTSDPRTMVSWLTPRDRSRDFDVIAISLSPRGDGLTGYLFRVNPHGVQRDAALSEDGVRDASWDAVWTAETHIDEDRWTAEFAIPIDELRFPEGRETWGFQVARWMAGKQESATFNPVPPEASGWVSNAGLLAGVEEIEPQLPLSVTPEAFVSYRDTTDEFYGRGEEGFDFGIGGYGKIGLAPDLVLDLAVNPDFGQVEVDQAVLNLSAYETRFAEKRPFFLEGAGTFSTPIQLFYSRRLGGPPRSPVDLTGTEWVSGGPSSTPILGAAKLSGRSSGGLTVGVIEAVMMPTELELTDDATGEVHDRLSSRWTNAAVVRLAVEPIEGSTFGVLATAFNPDDTNGAYTGGVDWDLVTDDRMYALRGQLAGSLRFEGVPGMEPSQGAAVWTQLARQGGEHLRLWANFNALGPGFDPNDLGFLSRDDIHTTSLHVQLRQSEQWGPILNGYAGVRPKMSWNFDGLDLGRGGDVYAKVKWQNSLVTEVGVFGDTSRFDDRETRGGPPLELPARVGGWFWGRTSEHAPVGMRLWVMAHSEMWGYEFEVAPTFELRVGRVELELTPGYARDVGEKAWVDTLTDDAGDDLTVIGRRDMDTFDFTLKGALVIIRDLTFQLSGQVLTARADYSRYRYLYNDQTTEIADYPDDSADFATADLRAQALLRWEYLPGSAVYLVYTHFGLGTVDTDDHSIGTAFKSLDDPEHEQVFMLKLSHRFG
ncbi:MAG: carbohydrate binding family 9 domain-containing protein [Deltaproteobacteria bacterium]|nr:carbohydrate binding family 9 domain-containing protein [Deltaproteobacteria bacterium]